MNHRDNPFLGGCNSHRGILALPCCRQEQRLSKPKAVFVPEIPSSLGEHIRKKRIELGLFQNQVGRELGVSKDCVANWENGRNHPIISHYPKIISFLGYSPFKLEEVSLGARILTYRYENGLSAKKFGRLIGVGEYAILAIEQNKGNPKEKTIQKVNQIIQ